MGGCGPVPGNYPQDIHREPPRSIDTLSAVAADAGAFTIRIGELHDNSRLLAAKQETYAMMRAGTGESAVKELERQMQAASPWLTRFESMTESSFYRGSIELNVDRAVVIERGALVVEMVCGPDTITVRDEGIAFFRHDARPLDCLYTGDGPVRYVRAWNDLPLRAENRCNVILPRRGRIVGLTLDPTRFRVLDP